MEGNGPAGDQRPVHRLPPELLEQVFRDLRESVGWSWGDITSFNLRSRIGGRGTWIRITSVCRHWRLVAVQAPRLWTLIWLNPGLGASFLPVFLSRSETAPLRVSLSHVTKDIESILTLLLPHTGRICRLNIEGPAIGIFPRLIGRLNILEEAKLSNRGSEASGPMLHFSRDDFPRLRKLSLGLVDVAWDTFSLASLDELSVECYRRGLSTKSLLRIMHDSPELRVLKLPCYGDAPSATRGLQVTTSGIVSLEHLDYVVLSGILQEVTYVLDHVTLPSGECIIRVNYDRQSSEHAIHPIQMLLPRQLAFQPLLPYYTTLSVVVYTDVNISAFDEASWLLSSRSLLLKSSEKFFHNIPTLTEETWMPLLDAFSRSPLSRFCLRYHFLQSISPQMWAALFLRFPTLDTLEVWFCEGQPWKDWKDRRRTPASPGCLLDNMFTGLREPCAHRVRALELKSLEMNAYTTEAVFRLLDDRAAMGAPMESLVFSRCYCEDALDTRAVKKRFESYAGLALSIRYSDLGRFIEPDEFMSYVTRQHHS